ERGPPNLGSAPHASTYGATALRFRSTTLQPQRGYGLRTARRHAFENFAPTIAPTKAPKTSGAPCASATCPAKRTPQCSVKTLDPASPHATPHALPRKAAALGKVRRKAQLDRPSTGSTTRRPSPRHARNWDQLPISARFAVAPSGRQRRAI